MAGSNSICCPSCREYTSITVRKRHIVVEGIHYRNIPERAYEIGECNSCSQHFLVERIGNKIKKIHPKPLPKPVDPRIPEFLKKDLEEAYACLAANAYRATGMMARRAVELLCIDKKAPEGSLIKKIDWLLEQQIITKDLRDWAHEIRLTGNEAAHPPKTIKEENPISENDAKDILELLESLVNALYITNHKKEERKQRRNERKQK